MKTFTELCQDLGVSLSAHSQEDIDKLLSYCRTHISRDKLFLDEEEITFNALAKYITLYLEVFLPNVHDDDLLVEVPEFNNVSSLQFILENGFDLYLESLTLSDKELAQTFGVMTPLHVSANKGYTSMTKVLLEKGANSTNANSREELAIHYALSLPFLYTEEQAKAKEETFLLLYQNAPETIEKEMQDGSSVMHIMAIKGYMALLSDMVIKHPALMYKQDNFGKCPIHAAILNENSDTVELLLNAGKPNDMVDFQGKGPLHYAVHALNERTFALCLEACHGDIDIRDKAGETPLMLAVKSGDLTRTQQLMAAHANVLGIHNNAGRNALQLAIDCQEFAIAKHIITTLPEAAASLDEQDKEALARLNSTSGSSLQNR